MPAKISSLLIDMSNEFKAKLKAIVERVVPECRAQVQSEIDSVLQAGANSYDDWLAILEDPDATIDIRRTVCWTLARLGDERALPALLAVLKDPNPPLRAEAGLALGTLNIQQAVQPLIVALQEDEDVKVRTAAAYGLGLLGDNHAVEPLVNKLADQNEDPQVRGQAAEALSDIRDNRAVTPLIAALRDTSVEVRFWAVFALGQLGDRQALPELERLAATDEAILSGWGALNKEAADAIESIQAQRGREDPDSADSG